MWANVSPTELHFTYGIRVPGDRGDTDGDIDWDELRVKYFDTDLLSFVKDSVPLLESAKEEFTVTLREYLELWRMRQERNLERMAMTEDRRYEPKLFDLVFTSKCPANRIGHHLDVIWSGPSTITSLNGTAMVGITPGIILEGVGGVVVSEDGKSLEVPEGYGPSEVYPLKNIKHAPALQGVIYGYLQEGKRVFLDSQGAIKDMTLRPGTEIDDLRLLQRARKKIDLEKIVRESGRVRGEFGSEPLLPPGICPSDEETQQLEDRVLPPESFIMGDSEEGVPSEDEDPDEEDMVDLSRLREQLGVGDGYEFGRFMKKAPLNGSVVVVVDHSYNGLAIVLEGDEGTEDGSMLVQPMRVELLGGCLELAKATDKDILTAQLDNMVYVSPCCHKWTRKRSRDLLKLLHDVQVPRC
ncbi:hypothetical protein Pmar_PMAR029470 [Perkinsus marinus ATCC 50983]|uniref:Uncharacterized protein n=1 Tax=Perkinsus marinus (strain ATCC 50983 / TXsc) TaxID=423536 RepID=C5KGR9_PERM5|nr:hypothetical protein Pmar_PMAR029470 [Perkinsus marinus ATCC 50983]EER16337.1 hypothetical protein Pmar_PMAR029470 [Perkinsus marinus ATCC 50983]|eukprot:XP_002784541.1 hypothetical protein Pmar_PMAR029470 [Perkinsus marinus ATCC 50983]